MLVLAIHLAVSAGGVQAQTTQKSSRRAALSAPAQKQANPPAVAKSGVRVAMRPEIKPEPASNTRSPSESAVGSRKASDRPQPDPGSVAAKLDSLVQADLRSQRVSTAGVAREEDFIRRATFDLVGRVPTPEEIMAYEQWKSTQRRDDLVDQLVATDEFADNVARYWRDVLLERATQAQYQRMAEQSFVTWMSEQIRAGYGWDKIASEMIAATGTLPEDGSTALIFLQNADPVEVAAETSRVFLGVQLQCAQCHDHPYEDWTRQQFHELAAFFPRVRVQRYEEGEEVRYGIVSNDPPAPEQPAEPRRPANPFAQYEPNFLLTAYDLDKNRKLDATELGGSELGQALSRVDRNNDGMMDLEELTAGLRVTERRVPRRGEHLMPDLKAPELPGDMIDPKLFTNGKSPEPFSADQVRRGWLAEQITHPDNPWFARTFVNRVWNELMGKGFYDRPDDLTKDEPDEFAEALETLTEAFVDSGYDIRWLYRTVARTKTYQRAVRTYRPWSNTAAFASAMPVRLRADALFSSLETIFYGGQSALLKQFSRMTAPGGSMMESANLEGPREQFRRLFHYDPSTPQDELLGSVPQALFMMNSPMLDRLIKAQRGTPFAAVIATTRSNPEAVTQCYLLALGRRPSRDELNTCMQYMAAVGDRREALEDILWSLLNSSEFLTRR